MGVCFFSPPGSLSTVAAEIGISQVVSLPSNIRTVITSGQCGFREDLSISTNLKEQMEMTFLNAEKTLQAAGVRDGLQAVYQMTIYALQIDAEFDETWRELRTKYMGSHMPVGTAVTVPALYRGARVEMTFYAATC